MIGPAYCNGCGKRLEVPAGYGKSKIRCPDCGVFTELPKEIREQGQESDRPKRAAPAPPPPAPKPAVPAKPAPPKEEEAETYSFREEPTADVPDPPRRAKPAAEEIEEVEEIPDREVLIHGTEEDDLNPYTVTGDAPTKSCPGCDRRVDKRVAVCKHCGYNFETKQKAKRTYEPVHREWEEGWPFDRRLMVFIAAMVINFVSLVALMIGGFGTTSFVLVIMTVALQAFLLGTYGKLALDRTQKGKITVTTTWRVAFIPQPTKQVRWKEHENVIVVQSNEFNPIDWCFALILLGYCIVPGILFYWFVIHADKFTVFLGKEHGMAETPIFRALSQDRAKEVMQAVSEVTTLPIHT